MKFVFPIAVAVFLLCLSGCELDGTNSETDTSIWGPQAVTLEHKVSDPQLTWHDRYVMDNCARCPDCCVSVPEWDSLDEHE